MMQRFIVHLIYRLSLFHGKTQNAGKGTKNGKPMNANNPQKDPIVGYIVATSAIKLQ